MANNTFIPSKLKLIILREMNIIIFIPYLFILFPAISMAEVTSNINNLSVTTAPKSKQIKKLHSELSDPVLQDRASVVEWAWSPQYANQFKLEKQKNGLKDGWLWLVGVKVQRQQDSNTNRQSYSCRVVGVIDNKAPILWPAKDQYLIHPGYRWVGGLPGNFNYPESINGYTPAQAAWYKHPKNSLQKSRPETSITVPYISVYRHFTEDLAYFEIDASCSHFRDPKNYRNEMRFPTTKQKNHNKNNFFEDDPLVMELPDDLMRRIYPYTIEAEDWSSCFLRRVGGKGNLLSNRSMKLNRFGDICEPSIAQ